MIGMCLIYLIVIIVLAGALYRDSRFAAVYFTVGIYIFSLRALLMHKPNFLQYKKDPLHSSYMALCRIAV